MYEVAISINANNIVWVHGPFTEGLWLERKNFNFRLKHVIERQEVAVADKVNISDQCSTHKDQHRSLHKRMGARYENLNRRLL